MKIKKVSGAIVSQTPGKENLIDILQGSFLDTENDNLYPSPMRLNVSMPVVENDFNGLFYVAYCFTDDVAVLNILSQYIDLGELIDNMYMIAYVCYKDGKIEHVYGIDDIADYLSEMTMPILQHHYMWVPGNPVRLVENIDDWRFCLNNSVTAVDLTEIEYFTISTIFLIIDHNANNVVRGAKETPILFETMIFDYDDTIKRQYTSEEDARKGHIEAVAFVKEHIKQRG